MSEQQGRGTAIREACNRLLAQDSWQAPYAEAALRELDEILTDLEDRRRLLVGEGLWDESDG